MLMHRMNGKNRGAGAAPQPRARHPRVQPPRARAGGGRVRAAARAAAVPDHRLLEPRRVLRDPRRGHQGADQARHHRSRPGRDDAEGDARDRDARGARARHAAVRPPERRAAAAARERRDPIPEARHLERRAARLGARLLQARGAAGPDADRPRSRPPVSAPVQQEPQPHRRARGPRRLRPQLARRDRAGAAHPAARDPPAAVDRRGRILLRLPDLGAARARGRSCSPA